MTTTAGSAKYSSSDLTGSAGGGDVSPRTASLFMPQKNENFNDKLKLWKFCILVIKNHDMTLEKIVKRTKDER